MIPGTTPGLSGFDSSAPSTARLQALQQLLNFDTGVSLIQAASSITSNSLTNSKILSQALASAPTLLTQFPATGLGNQLKQVAQIIAIRSSLGLNRQVFFCSLACSFCVAMLGMTFGLLKALSGRPESFYVPTSQLGSGLSSHESTHGLLPGE